MANDEVASARDVALEIERRLPGIGKVKLHKLLYYVQGYHLAWEQGPAFVEDIEAWDLGPVVERLWRNRKYRLFDKIGRSSRSSGALPESVRDITANAISRVGHLSGTELIEATHAKNPWRQTTNEGRSIAN